MIVLAFLVGGPDHGAEIDSDSYQFVVALPAPLSAAVPELGPAASAVALQYGEYRARRHPSGRGFDVLPNGRIPFDYVGPGGPTWHERRV